MKVYINGQGCVAAEVTKMFPGCLPVPGVPIIVSFISQEFAMVLVVLYNCCPVEGEQIVMSPSLKDNNCFIIQNNF